jgi:hypothetical protein
MRDVRELSWQDFVKLFDSSILGSLDAMRGKPGVCGLMALRCEVLDSSRCGMISGMLYGPDCTFKSVEQASALTGGVYVTGLPSSAAFPFAYTRF